VGGRREAGRFPVSSFVSVFGFCLLFFLFVCLFVPRKVRRQDNKSEKSRARTRMASFSLLYSSEATLKERPKNKINSLAAELVLFAACMRFRGLLLCLLDPVCGV
jgi:uncharacterized membrane protein YfcA